MPHRIAGSFGDGFGAPRYAGGYHLHKGVDMVAPKGTPIYAPFDGVAHSYYNSLGGNVVFVSGRYGTSTTRTCRPLLRTPNGPVTPAT